MRDGVVLTRTVPFASTAPLGTVSRLTCVNAQRMKSSIFVIFIPPQRKAPQAPIGHYRPGLQYRGYLCKSCHPAYSIFRFPTPCCHCTVSGLQAFRNGFRRFLSSSQPICEVCACMQRHSLPPRCTLYPAVQSVPDAHSG